MQYQREMQPFTCSIPFQPTGTTPVLTPTTQSDRRHRSHTALLERSHLLLTRGFSTLQALRSFAALGVC